jgi:hypothetical protein
MDAELKGLHEAVHAALIDQRQRLIPLIEASLPKGKAARMKALPDDWWDPKRERSAFLKALQTAYLRLTRGALEVVANNVGRVVLPTPSGRSRRSCSSRPACASTTSTRRPAARSSTP